MIFLSRRFLQKWILLYYYETSGWLVFVRFSEEIKGTKKTFPNQRTFNNFQVSQKYSHIWGLVTTRPSHNLLAACQNQNWLEISKWDNCSFCLTLNSSDIHIAGHSTTIWTTPILNLDFHMKIQKKYWGQFSKLRNFLLVCWFLGKNLSKFTHTVWQLHNPYWK